MPIRKSPPAPHPLPVELPSTRLQDHPEYKEAWDRYQRIQEEHRALVLQIREIGEGQSRALAGFGAGQHDARAAHQVSAAEAYLNGDREAALAPPPAPSPSVLEQLQKEEAVAKGAVALAHQRLQETGERIAKEVCDAYRPLYLERLQAVLDTLAALDGQVQEAEKIANGMRAVCGPHRPSPAVHLDEFRFSKHTSAVSILRRQLKTLGIEVDR